MMGSRAQSPAHIWNPHLPLSSALAPLAPRNATPSMLHWVPVPSDSELGEQLRRKPSQGLCARQAPTAPPPAPPLPAVAPLPAGTTSRSPMGASTCMSLCMWRVCARVACGVCVCVACVHVWCVCACMWHVHVRVACVCVYLTTSHLPSVYTLCVYLSGVGPLPSSSSTDPSSVNTTE